MSLVPRDAAILTVDAMRAAEQAWFDSGGSQQALMERAGQAVAREAARLANGRAVLVLAGPGNNGGDAFAAAQRLAERGIDVMVATDGSDWRGAAGAMRAAWRGPVVPVATAQSRPVLIDGLFGIGIARPIEPALAQAVTRLAEQAALVIAIDLPSGMDGDARRPLVPAVAAQITVALGALKPAHVTGEYRAHCGHVLLAPIGLPIVSDTRTIHRPVIAAPSLHDHKYTRGRVVVVAGAMAGAARLAAQGAANGAAGYVVLAGDNARVPHDAIVHRTPDSLRDMIEDERVGAIVIGCGLGRGADARSAVAAVVASRRPIVLDGDALALVDPQMLTGRTNPTILTPHSGEFGRLFGDGAGNRIDRTRTAARRTSAVVVHKGADTLIASPDGQVVVAHPPGWLSTAGTGDVLAGLVGARLAATGDAMRAAQDAVWLHARAARLAGPAFVADSLAMHVPAAIAECR